MLSIPRPITRGDCLEEARPCPWSACKHHLVLEVAKADGDRNPSLRLNQRSSTGGRRPGLRSSAAVDLVRTWIDDAIQLMVEMPFTCVLDVVATYPAGLPAAEVGWILGVSKQAIEQEEKRPHVQDAFEQLRELLDDE